MLQKRLADILGVAGQLSSSHPLSLTIEHDRFKAESSSPTHEWMNRVLTKLCESQEDAIRTHICIDYSSRMILSTGWKARCGMLARQTKTSVGSTQMKKDQALLEFEHKLFPMLSKEKNTPSRFSWPHQHESFWRHPSEFDLRRLYSQAAASHFTDRILDMGRFISKRGWYRFGPQQRRNGTL